MNNADFWASIAKIIDEGFLPEGLEKLDTYAERFIDGRLVYQRFSSNEQHGCTAGGICHVIASLLAGSKVISDSASEEICDFKREVECGEKQAQILESWAKQTGLWLDDVDHCLYDAFGPEIAEGGEAKVYDHGATLVKAIGLDYFIQPILALDRITLHNTYFPETNLTVIGFGRDMDGFFKIIVEQPFIKGNHVDDEEIEEFMKNMGFKLYNPRNWTYATPDIYLSDMHDENVLKSDSGTIFVVDCDIRINTPQLNVGGIRKLSTDICFK